MAKATLETTMLEGRNATQLIIIIRDGQKDIDAGTGTAVTKTVVDGALATLKRKFPADAKMFAKVLANQKRFGAQ